MSPRKKLTLAACAMVMTTLVFLWTRPSVPSYQGVTIDEWFNRYSGFGNSQAADASEPPKLAFAAMGTNAIPFLAKRITQPLEYSRLDLLRAKYFKHIPKRVTPLLPRPLGRRYTEGMDAARLVLHIQPPGRLLVPLITPVLQSSNSLQRRIGFVALGGISSDWETARPYLAQGLKDRDQEVQKLCLSAIQRQGFDGAWAAADLAETLHTFDFVTLQAALKTLDRLETNALPIVPRLKAILANETDGSRRRVLEVAIEDISLWAQ